jgi:hypothetical protein
MLAQTSFLDLKSCMCICVHMHVCICIRIALCVCPCVYISKQVESWVCVPAFSCSLVRVWVCALPCACMCVCNTHTHSHRTPIRTNTKQAYTNVRTQIQTLYIYTHAHTYTHILPCPSCSITQILKRFALPAESFSRVIWQAHSQPRQAWSPFWSLGTCLSFQYDSGRDFAALHLSRFSKVPYVPRV